MRAGIDALVECLVFPGCVPASLRENGGDALTLAVLSQVLGGVAREVRSLAVDADADCRGERLSRNHSVEKQARPHPGPLPQEREPHCPRWIAATVW
jgi:hypothetical protein